VAKKGIRRHIFMKRIGKLHSNLVENEALQLNKMHGSDFEEIAEVMATIPVVFAQHNDQSVPHQKPFELCSYNGKHRIEDLRGKYVSTPHFIAAMCLLGFQGEWVDDGRNYKLKFREEILLRHYKSSRWDAWEQCISRYGFGYVPPPLSLEEISKWRSICSLLDV